MSPIQSVQHELRNHAAALRALARDLVGASDADDLVQETALRALRRPPQQPGSLGRFFATVLRNLASKHRRGERRRLDRERLAARAEAQPAAGDFVERRETLRRVTLAVFALPEPHLTTLLLRYFEDLTPTEISERTGAPLATVKSRLQRGIALLRSELNRGDRGQRWQKALLAATGLKVTIQPLVTTGAVLMLSTTKLAVAAAAAGAAVLLLTLQSDPAPPPAASAPHDDAPVAEAAVDTESTQPPVSERVELKDVVMAPGVDLTHPFAFELHCTVRDRDGLPVKGAQLLVAPTGCGLNTWNEATGANGRLVLRWRGREPSMTMAVGVRSGGSARTLQQVQVNAGLKQELALLGEASKLEVQREYLRTVLTTKGQPKRTTLGETKSDCPLNPAAKPKDCRGCHGGPSEFRGVVDGRLATRRGLHPEVQFGDLLLPALETPAQPLTIKTSYSVAKTRGLALPSKESKEVTPTGTIAGFIYDANGKPAAGTTVVWGSAVDLPIARTLTGADGAFELKGVRIGPAELRAGGGDLGLQHSRVMVGGTTRCNLVLAPGAVIRGRAVGPDGAPLTKWRVEFASNSEPWSDECTVHEDGTFVLPNLPPGPGRLLLWPREGSLPVATESTVLLDCLDVSFDLRGRGEPTGSLRLKVIVPDDAGPVSAEARVWQVDSGRGAAMGHDKLRAFVLEKLAAGFYRVEVGADATGWVDLGEKWVDGKGLTDLGLVTLPRPGRVRVSRHGGEPAIKTEFYLRRPDGDVRAEDIRAAQGSELLLPAGEWLCLWRKEGGPLHALQFTVRSAAEVDLQVGLEPASRGRR